MMTYYSIPEGKNTERNLTGNKVVIPVLIHSIIKIHSTFAWLWWLWRRRKKMKKQEIQDRNDIKSKKVLFFSSWLLFPFIGRNFWYNNDGEKSYGRMQIVWLREKLKLNIAFSTPPNFRGRKKKTLPNNFTSYVFLIILLSYQTGTLLCYVRIFAVPPGMCVYVSSLFSYYTDCTVV